MFLSVIIKYDNNNKYFEISFDKDLYMDDIEDICEYIKQEYKKQELSLLRKLKLKIKGSNLKINCKYRHKIKQLTPLKEYNYYYNINYKENKDELLNDIKQKMLTIIKNKENNKPKQINNQKFTPEEIDESLEILEKLNDLYKYLGYNK